MITGTVIKGVQEARRYGTPTANLWLDSFSWEPGTYAASLRVQDATYPSVAFVSQRDERWLLEVHALDQDLDLYGATITVSLEAHLSAPVPYESSQQMQRKIEQDLAAARTYFS